MVYTFIGLVCDGCRLVFDLSKIKEVIKQELTFEEFFEQSQLHENAHLITGTICGIKLEEIESPITKQVRYLDKLVDELAKGRMMDKILRVA